MSLTFEGDGTISGFDSGLSGFGGLVAVKHVLKTDTFSASVGASGNVAVTGLSIAHELADPSNKLIISAFLGSAGNSYGYGTVGIAVHDGSSLIAIGDAAGSRTRATAGGAVTGSASVAIATMPSVTFVYTPGAGSKTYTVRAINIEASTRTLYINRAQGDSDIPGYTRAVSSLVIQEVSV